MFNGIIFNQGLITKFEKRSKGINIFVKADLKLTRKDNFTLSCDEKLFFRVVKQAFMHRRKTLRNSLKTFELSDSLKANVIFDKRPEQLNVQAFIDLTTLIENDEKEID